MVGEPDPTPPDDAWADLTRQLTDLGTALRSHYRDADELDALADVRTALEDLGSAAGRLGDAATTALRDPIVQRKTKATLAALIRAVGATVEDVRNPPANGNSG